MKPAVLCLLLALPQIMSVGREAIGQLALLGPAERLVRLWPSVCWEDRCVPMESVLTLIDHEGREVGKP